MTLPRTPQEYPTVENRRSPGQKTSYDFVHKGEYTLEMSYKNSGLTIPCLRFMDPFIRGFLIHRASSDDWTTLEGCIAPGMSSDGSSEIRGSKDAMYEILELLGGFEEGKRVTLRVENNGPEEEGTREEWLRERREKALRRQGKDKRNRR